MTGVYEWEGNERWERRGVPFPPGPTDGVGSYQTSVVRRRREPILTPSGTGFTKKDDRTVTPDFGRGPVKEVKGET